MSVVQVNFYSCLLSKSVNVTVVLPYGNWRDIGKAEETAGGDGDVASNIENSSTLDSNNSETESGFYARKEYRVLYLLHGYQGDNLSWIRNSSVEKYAERNETIVVMPSGENSFYVNIPGLHLRMEDFITKELRDFVENTFPVKKGRKNRAVAGLSMGGYGSLRLGLLYPELYSSIGAFSPPYITTDEKISPFFFGEFKEASELVFGKSELWQGSDYDIYHLTETLAERVEKLNLTQPYIYLACGEQDNLIYGNRKMAEILEKHSQNYSYTEGSGGHIWAYWDRHLSRYMSRFAKSK